MRSSTLLLLLLSLSCGGGKPAAPNAPSASSAKDPYAGSPLVGRWTSGDRTLEFIADGTLVDLVAFEAERSTRQDDGTRVNETAELKRCHMGSFRVEGERVEYDLVEVSGSDDRTGAWTWHVDGTTLTLDEEEFSREEGDVPAGAQRLVGLWRRTKLTSDSDAGLRFTPGGLVIVVGRRTWSGAASLSWFCCFYNYEVDGANLRETDPNRPERPRSRPFKLEGDQLTLGPTLVYERVRGVVPVHDGKLDFTAFKALE